MRTTITIIFAFFLTSVFGQTDDYNVLLDSAKTLFKTKDTLRSTESEHIEYSQIISMLEKVIELNPNSAEARYFLGCTYGRINSFDGESIIDMDLELVYLTSEQFEKTIELTPNYVDEIWRIDPYSKLSSEWGSLAMRYLYENKVDSAVWAFKEGKKRGGFSDFTLQINRNILDVCSKNAILAVSGDNFIIPMWYLQAVENYRTDVAVISTSLLNSTWYPRYLYNNKIVAFDLPNEVIDTLQYTEWSDKIIKTKKFSWTLKPSYYNAYLLRGDRLFLSILKKNKFKRELYFTTGFVESEMLNLKSHLSPLIIVNKLDISGKKMLLEDYKKNVSNSLKLSEYLNFNSTDERKMFDYYVCYGILDKVRDYLNNNEKTKAKELMNLLDKFAEDKNFLFYVEDIEKYIDFIRQSLTN